MLAIALVVSILAPAQDSEPAIPPPPTSTPESSPPQAETGGDIQWIAPATCPDGHAMVRRTSELLGRPLADGELRVHGRIEATSGGYTLVLQLSTDAPGPTQRLEAPSCETLAQTAALIAAVLLDPVAAVTTVDREMASAPDEEPPAEPTPAERSEPVATPEPEPEPEPEPRPPRARPTRTRSFFGWARVRGGGSFGAVPGGTGGFDGSFSLGTQRLRAELLGAYFIGREVQRNQGRATVSLGHGTLRFCGLVLPGAVQIPLCAGLELGAMRADARGVPQARTRRGFWLAGHAAAGVRWSFRPRLSLWVEAQLFVPAVFPRFELVDPVDASLTAEVYRPNVAGGRGLVGIEYKVF